MNELKDRLVQRMQELNIRATDLAKRTGLSPTLISRYRSGVIRPRGENLYLIAKALNVSEAWLLGQDVPKSRTNVIELDDVRLYNAPLFESVSAGLGKQANEQIVGYIPVMINSTSEIDNTLCIKVQGDSMSPLISNGDIVQVRRQDSVDSGDIAVVLIDGTEGFIKRIEYDVDSIRLVSINPNYPAVTLSGKYVQRCRVVGKVIRLLRDI